MSGLEGHSLINEENVLSATEKERPRGEIDHRKPGGRKEGGGKK